MFKWAETSLFKLSVCTDFKTLIQSFACVILDTWYVNSSKVKLEL